MHQPRQPRHRLVIDFEIDAGVFVSDFGHSTCVSTVGNALGGIPWPSVAFRSPSRLAGRSIEGAIVQRPTPDVNAAELLRRRVRCHSI